MTPIPFLDIILSLVFIYALLSILVSIINEMLSHYNEERGLLLKRSILKLLADDLNLQYGELFYNHPNIQRITKFSDRFKFLGLIKNPSQNQKKTRPSYISASLFASTLVDIIAMQNSLKQPVNLKRDEQGLPLLDEHGRKSYTINAASSPSPLLHRFEQGVANMRPSPLRDTLQGMLDRCGNDLNTLETLLQNWFNDYMERVSGWYKSQQRSKSIVVGLLVALLLNVDALHLIKSLSMDVGLRNKLVNEAMLTATRYEALSDSARQDVGQLLTTFAIQDSSFKRIRDSVGGKHHFAIKNDPSPLVMALKKNTTRFSSQIQKIVTQDSIAKDAMEKADRIIGIASALNIPIGFSTATAPLSWLPWNKSKIVKSELNTADAGVLAYNERRNTGREAWTFTKYLLGILISGFSLSVGAPFWFNILLKLVDIRRAGVKPIDKK